MIRILCPEAPILAESLNRGLANLNRTNELVTNYELTANKDILRLSVVFIHATLEDVLRNLIFFKLHQLEHNSALLEVPLINTQGRKDKINLSDLIKYQSLTVKDLLVQSCLEYVDRLTFNNSNDILKWFDKFQITNKDITEYLSSIEELLQRRHKIVHNADLPTDRLQMNTLQESLHDGKPNTIEDITKEFVLNKIQILYPFIFKCTKAFLPKNSKITMQNA